MMLPKSLISNTIFDISRRQNATFWVSQIAIILSTILGVYLAASAGLKTAINFHSTISQEKNFYTLSAIREEVQSNNQLIIDFADKHFILGTDGKVTSIKYNKTPELNWFVWTTMTNATETLELPVDILKDTNRYYINLNKAIDNFERMTGRDKLFAARRLHKLSRGVESQLIARMDEQIKRYHSRFSQYDKLGKY